MALRDALVKAEEGEEVPAYLDRCLAKVVEVTGSAIPRIRMELVYNLFGSDSDSKLGVALWYEQEKSIRSESWQRLTVNMYGSFEESLALVGQAMMRLLDA